MTIECNRFLLEDILLSSWNESFTFQGKGFLKPSCLTATTLLSSLGGAIQHRCRSQNMTCFRLQFYLGFVLRCTMQSSYISMVFNMIITANLSYITILHTFLSRLYRGRIFNQRWLTPVELKRTLISWFWCSARGWKRLRTIISTVKPVFH